MNKAKREPPLQCPFPQKRRGTPRLPWKRGPRAWEIAQRADSILENLNASRRGFYSLRQTAKLLGISTQPVRDWIRLGYLGRTGPRRQISRAELGRFVQMLAIRAEPFDTAGYVDRIECHRKVPRGRWRKLALAQFVWPKGVDSLRPSQLSALVGCHPSLVVKAIRAGRLRGERQTRCRWAITHWRWRQAFGNSF